MDALLKRILARGGVETGGEDFAADLDTPEARAVWRCHQQCHNAVLRSLPEETGTLPPHAFAVAMLLGGINIGREVNPRALRALPERVRAICRAHCAMEPVEEGTAMAVLCSDLPRDDPRDFLRPVAALWAEEPVKETPRSELEMILCEGVDEDPPSLEFLVCTGRAGQLRPDPRDVMSRRDARRVFRDSRKMLDTLWSASMRISFTKSEACRRDRGGGSS